MSPSSIVSFPSSVLLISSILILISTPNTIAIPSSPPSLIQFACSDQKSTDLISAMHALRTYSTYHWRSWSREFQTRRIRATTREAAALKECKQAYDDVVDRWSDARLKVKELDFDSPISDLLIVSLQDQCEDAIISRGNGAVPIFGFSAFMVVSELYYRSTTPPPPPTIRT